MAERPLHVVVSTTRTDAGTRALAAAAADAFEATAGGASAPPIALPVDDGGARAPDRSSELEGADVLVALDAVALESARSADVGLRVALWPGLGDAWLGSVESADLVLVAHPSQIEVALERGAARDSVVVVGPLRAEGHAPAVDRDATASALGVPVGSRVLVVPVAAMPGMDLSGTFTQLALVKPPLFVLFDVEDDVEAAKAIRSLSPRFGLAAAMFSERAIAKDAYAIADRVLVRLEGPETFAALASGAPLFVVKPKTREAASARALADAHLTVVAANATMIAVALDAALTPEALALARTAVTALDPRGTGERIAAAVADARARHRSRATGLPRGLEVLSRDPADALIEALAPLARSQSTRKKAEDDAVERELEELKKRISG